MGVLVGEVGVSVTFISGSREKGAASCDGGGSSR